MLVGRCLSPWQSGSIPLSPSAPPPSSSMISQEAQCNSEQGMTSTACLFIIVNISLNYFPRSIHNTKNLRLSSYCAHFASANGDASITHCLDNGKFLPQISLELLIKSVHPSHCVAPIYVLVSSPHKKSPPPWHTKYMPSPEGKGRRWQRSFVLNVKCPTGKGPSTVTVCNRHAQRETNPAQDPRGHYTFWADFTGRHKETGAGCNRGRL